uniref:Uncharacterized protein n=1 Tax=Desulfovibrio sp. U5L TaxID=596152 RepID=I2Q4F1_9BACT
MTKAELIERIKAQLAIDPATSHIHEKTVIPGSQLNRVL